MRKKNHFKRIYYCRSWKFSYFFFLLALFISRTCIWIKWRTAITSKQETRLGWCLKNFMTNYIYYSGKKMATIWLRMIKTNILETRVQWPLKNSILPLLSSGFFMELLLIKMKLIAHREGVQPSDPLNKAYVDNIPGILVRPSILALFLFDQP